jgi:hypothetical protein
MNRSIIPAAVSACRQASRHRRNSGCINLRLARDPLGVQALVGEILDFGGREDEQSRTSYARLRRPGLREKSSAVGCEARVLDRTKPLAKLAAMAMIVELTVIDGSNPDRYDSCVGRMAWWAQLVIAWVATRCTPFG